jgi:hypothetical protein
VNLSEFLWDGDGLHQGEISRSKFRSAMARAGMTLKPYELDLLEHKFAVPRWGGGSDWNREGTLRRTRK